MTDATRDGPDGDGRAGATAWRTAACVFALVAAVALAFAPTFGAGFVDWDDPQNLVQNPHWRGFTGANLVWMLTTPHMGHYTPLTWLSFMLDHALFGPDPRALHAMSVAWHAATAIACFFLARRILDAWSRRSRAGDALPERGRNDRGTPPETGRDDRDTPSERGRSDLIALLAAALFALHPLRVESVAWLTERRDLVSGLFCVLALSAWCRYVENGRRTRDCAWTLAASVLAWAGKGTAVVLPALFVVIDLAVYARLAREPLRRIALEKVPFLLLALCAVPVTLTAAASAGTTLKGLAAHGLAERAAQAAYALLFHPLRSIAPFALRPIYPLPEPFVPSEPRFLAAIAGIIVVTVLAWLARRRAPALGAAWCAYVLALLPVSGLFQAGPQLVAERYSYVACLPFALLAAGGLEHVARRSRALAAASAAVAVLVCGALGVLTARYASAWRSSDALWSHTLAVDAENPHALLHLGALRYQEALAARDPVARTNALFAAQAFYDRGLAVSSLPELRANTALVLGLEAELEPGRRVDKLSEGLARLDEAFLLSTRGSGFDPVWHVQRAGFLAKLGRTAEALAALQAYTAARPEDPQGWRTLARVAKDAGDEDARVQAWRKLTELESKDAEARVELGLALETRGSMEEALPVFQAARELVRLGARLSPALGAELDRRVP